MGSMFSDCLISGCRSTFTTCRFKTCNLGEKMVTVHLHVSMWHVLWSQQSTLEVYDSMMADVCSKDFSGRGTALSLVGECEGLTWLCVVSLLDVDPLMVKQGLNPERKWHGYL